MDAEWHQSNTLIVALVLLGMAWHGMAWPGVAWHVTIFAHDEHGSLEHDLRLDEVNTGRQHIEQRGAALAHRLDNTHMHTPIQTISQGERSEIIADRELQTHTQRACDGRSVCPNRDRQGQRRISRPVQQIDVGCRVE